MQQVAAAVPAAVPSIRHPELVEGSVRVQPLFMTIRFGSASLWISVGLVAAFTLVTVRAEEDVQATEALWLVDHTKLVHKVKTLVIGDVDLKDATVKQTLDFLRRQTKLFDPDHQGINFASKDQSELDAIKVNVKLKHATVENVLNQFPMTRFDISDSLVTLQMSGDEAMYSRTFKVPDNVLAINPSMIVDANKQIYDVRPLFRAKGIKFPSGASAEYALPSKALTVVMVDPEEIIRIDEILVFGFKNVK